MNCDSGAVSRAYKTADHSSLKSGSEVLVPMDVLETTDGKVDNRNRLDGGSEGDLTVDRSIPDPMNRHNSLG
jgi:hypothetical protein